MRLLILPSFRVCVSLLLFTGTAALDLITHHSSHIPPQVQRRRPELRLVISSATLQADLLASFFSASGAGARHSRGAAKVGTDAPLGLPACPDPAILSVEGRTHPVEVGRGGGYHVHPLGPPPRSFPPPLPSPACCLH